MRRDRAAHGSGRIHAALLAEVPVRSSLKTGPNGMGHRAACALRAVFWPDPVRSLSRSLKGHPSAAIDRKGAHSMMMIMTMATAPAADGAVTGVFFLRRCASARFF